MPGEALPEVELPKLGGGSQAVVAAGGALLVNFWATWCPPCLAEMAALDRLHRALSPRGLRVFGIAVDNDIFQVDEYVRRHRLAFPILLDVGGTMARQLFRVPGYPTSYLAGPAGRIAERWIGEQAWDAADVRGRVERVL
jgi:thiol-disulfide isomerase/thioredoxin